MSRWSPRSCIRSCAAVGRACELTAYRAPSSAPRSSARRSRWSPRPTTMASTRVVSAAARARNIPVNVVDDADCSTFIFPAIIDRSPLLVAVSSAGHAPVLARRVREQIEALLPARLGDLARFMGAPRARVQRTLAPGARRAFWERIAGGAGRDAGARRGRGGGAPQLRPGAAHLAAHRCPRQRRWRAAGRGVPDRRRTRRSGPADAAGAAAAAAGRRHSLRPPGERSAVLERARRDAERIFVGKEAGEHAPAGAHSRAAAAARAYRQARRAPEGRRPVRIRPRRRRDRGCWPRTAFPAPSCRASPRRSAPPPPPGCRSPTGASRSASPSSAAIRARTRELDWRFFADPCHTVVFYMGVAQLPPSSHGCAPRAPPPPIRP